MRQGDPLSPLLFVPVADLLQSVVNDDLLRRGRLHLPIPSYGAPDSGRGPMVRISQHNSINKKYQLYITSQGPRGLEYNNSSYTIVSGSNSI